MGFRIFDCAGNLVIDGFMDYESFDRNSDTYSNLCVTGGDGSVTTGDPADVLACGSSLDWNLNIASPSFADRFTTNPQRVPVNSYAGGSADPNNPWI